MTTIIKRLLTTLLFSAFLTQSAQAALKLCVHDIHGEDGPYYTLMKDYKQLAKGWGIDINLKYSNHALFSRNDFKEERCDMLFAKDWPNKFVRSIEAIGAAPSNRVTYEALKLLANPKLAPKMKANGFVTLGAVPTGGYYFFVQDRNIDGVNRFLGKKFIVPDYSRDQEAMAFMFGGLPIFPEGHRFGSAVYGSDSELFEKLKSFDQDDEIVGAQLNMYGFIRYSGHNFIGRDSFDGLYYAIDTQGGVIDLPFKQGITMLVARDSVLSDTQVQQSREWIVDQLPKMFKLHKADKDSIEDRHWIKIDSKEKEKFEKLFRDLRMEMTDKGKYDPAMMNMLKQVRCQVDPSSFECSLQGE